MALNASAVMRAICCFNFPRGRGHTSISQFIQGIAYALDIALSNPVKKWKRQRSSVDPFGDGQCALPAGFALIDGLPMDGREISAAFDALRGHLRQDPFPVRAIKMRSKADHVHKPADGESGSVARRDNEMPVAAKFFRVDCRDCFPAAKDGLQPVDLGV